MRRERSEQRCDRRDHLAAASSRCAARGSV